MAALMIGGAIVGSGLSILQASQQRKIIERNKQFAIEAAKVRGDQLTARLGRQANRGLGVVSTGQAQRNVFGRSAARARLALTSEALDEQAAINLNQFIQISSITAEAEAQKPNLFTAAVSGASQGLSFGASLESAFSGKPDDPNKPSNNNNNNNTTGFLGRFGPTR